MRERAEQVLSRTSIKPLAVALVALLMAAVASLSVVVTSSRAEAQEGEPISRYGESVWAWGANQAGQLGDGTTKNRTKPVRVADLKGVKAVSAGSFHNLVVKNDGTVWAWGYGDTGQLGNGTSGPNATVNTSPVQAEGLTDVEAVAAGGRYSLALTKEGTVWAWGDGRVGQTCDGSQTVKTKPAQVPNLSGVKAIAAAWDHSLILKDDGTVWACGNGVYGKLGDGSGGAAYTPVQVRDAVGVGSQPFTGVKAIAAGGNHSLAIKEDGTAWAWGSNQQGQLGIGSSSTAWTPKQVSNLGGVEEIAGGGLHSLALKSDGTVWAWGVNHLGQLGTGDNTVSNVPVEVTGLTEGAKAISAGGGQNLALKEDGTVWAWGENIKGQLGDGTTTNRNKPVKTANLFGVEAIAAGNWHSLAIRGDYRKPTISRVSPKPGAKIKDRTPKIKATVKDNATDLARADVQLFVDGKEKTNFKYNQAKNKLVYKSGRLSYKRHKVKIVAEDASGNVGKKTWRFTVKR